MVYSSQSKLFAEKIWSEWSWSCRLEFLDLRSFRTVLSYKVETQRSADLEKNPSWARHSSLSWGVSVVFGMFLTKSSVSRIHEQSVWICTSTRDVRLLKKPLRWRLSGQMVDWLTGPTKDHRISTLPLAQNTLQRQLLWALCATFSKVWNDYL